MKQGENPRGDGYHRPLCCGIISVFLIIRIGIEQINQPWVSWTGGGSLFNKPHLLAKPWLALSNLVCLGCHSKFMLNGGRINA